MKRYTRQVHNPSGERKSARLRDPGSGSKSSACISRMPDGTVYLFDPTKVKREKRKPVKVHTVARVAEVQRLSAIVGNIGNVE